MAQPSVVYCRQCQFQFPAGTQQCSQCGQAIAPNYEELPSFKKSIYTDGSWFCPKCPNYVVQAGNVKCDKCGFVMMRLVEDNLVEIEEPAPPKVPDISLPAQQTWKCSCGYEWNLMEAYNCANCQASKPNSQAHQQAPIYSAPPPANSQSLWKCQTCHYEYNVYGQPCTKCAEWKAKDEQWKREQQQKYGQTVPVVPNSLDWTCKCGARQSKAKCPNCNMWKAAAVYDPPPQQGVSHYPSLLSSPAPAVSTGYPHPHNLSPFPPKVQQPAPQEPMWKCHDCPISNLMSSEKCIGCDKSRWRDTVNIEAPMIMGRWGWVCPTCFREQDIEINKCGVCKQLSPLGAALARRRRP